MLVNLYTERNFAAYVRKFCRIRTEIYLHTDGNFVRYVRRFPCIRTQHLRFLKRDFFNRGFEFAAWGKEDFDARNHLGVKRFGHVYSCA